MKKINRYSHKKEWVLAIMKASLELTGPLCKMTITFMVNQTLMMLESLCHEDSLVQRDFNSMLEKVYPTKLITRIRP
jgi:hypothetical protein